MTTSPKPEITVVIYTACNLKLELSFDTLEEAKKVTDVISKKQSNPFIQVGDNTWINVNNICYVVLNNGN